MNRPFARNIQQFSQCREIPRKNGFYIICRQAAPLMMCSYNSYLSLSGLDSQFNSLWEITVVLARAFFSRALSKSFLQLSTTAIKHGMMTGGSDPVHLVGFKENSSQMKTSAIFATVIRGLKITAFPGFDCAESSRDLRLSCTMSFVQDVFELDLAAAARSSVCPRVSRSPYSSSASLIFRATTVARDALPWYMDN